MEECEFTAVKLTKNTFFDSLPQRLQEELEKSNGYVIWGGGFHLRGICSEPLWHSLEDLCFGEWALFELFEEIQEGDIPFAQDCMGDQFIWRDGHVFRLYAEAGELEDLSMTLDVFFDTLHTDHESLLDLEVLEIVRESENSLKPGEVLIANPPFVMEESENGVKLEALTCLEALKYYAELAVHVQSLALGER